MQFGLKYEFNDGGAISHIWRHSSSNPLNMGVNRTTPKRRKNILIGPLLDIYTLVENNLVVYIYIKIYYSIYNYKIYKPNTTSDLSLYNSISV